MGMGGQTAALVKLKKQTRSTKMEEQRGGAGPVFPGPQIWGETVSIFSCWTLPSPFPHVQTESNCSRH